MGLACVCDFVFVMCACLCVHMRMRMRARVHVRERVRECVHVCMVCVCVLVWLWPCVWLWVVCMFEERRRANTRTHSNPCKTTFYFTDYHTTHSSRSRRRRVQVKLNDFTASVDTVKSI